MADRYISEKALIENISKIKDLRTLSTKTIGEAISKTPTADVVEVVRCKDCKFAWLHPMEDTVHCGRKRKSYPNMPFKKDDFCSYGERKEVTDNER